MHTNAMKAKRLLRKIDRYFIDGKCCAKTTILPAFGKEIGRV